MFQHEAILYEFIYEDFKNSALLDLDSDFDLELT